MKNFFIMITEKSAKTFKSLFFHIDMKKRSNVKRISREKIDGINFVYENDLIYYLNKNDKKNCAFHGFFTTIFFVLFTTRTIIPISTNHMKLLSIFLF